ncbi:ubiquinone biosynthesis regulatory protein kinase UbiB, partial [Salmonella enterica]
MPEIPVLVYDCLRLGKYLQHSVDNIARELHVTHVRQSQYLYLLGIGATLFLRGSVLLVNRPDWGLMPGWLMVFGVVVWLVVWRKTR